MAATATAWLCDLPIARWGEEWATGGEIDLRFRTHLLTGLDVDLIGEHEPDRIVLTIRHGDDQCVTGHATSAAIADLRVDPPPPPDPHRSEVAATRHALDGLVFHPVGFEFLAERDLTLATHLPLGSFWIDRGWAHPGWLATAANAVARTSVDLGVGTSWAYGGVRIALHAPIPDGSRLTISGGVSDLFETRRYRFAVCDLSIDADGRHAASMRTTFTYATLDG
jgi:hypothetical protein